MNATKKGPIYLIGNGQMQDNLPISNIILNNLIECVMSDKYQTRYTNEQCLEAILSIGEGEPISAEKYDSVTPRGLFPVSRTIIDKFGNWTRALNLSGFYPEIRYCLECRKKFEVFQRNKVQRFCSAVSLKRK